MVDSDNAMDESQAIELLEQMASANGFDMGVAGGRKTAPRENAPSRDGIWQPDLRYRALIERLPVVTFLASLDDTLQELYVSPQIEALLGFTQDEWLENPILWFRQLHPDDRDRWVAEFARTCSTGENFRAEYRLFARDGRVVWVQGECQLIRNEEGRPLFLQGIAFDITHLKHAAVIEEAKRAAEAANSAKSEFLARMSHEIRTPLNGVVGMIDLLRATELTANQQRYCQLARESADALLTVINDILDFSKIEAGKVETEALEFDLGKVVEDLTELMTPLAAKKNLALACFLRPELPRRMIGDPNRIRQVLTNLVSNALKFTSAGHVAIRIAVQSQDETNLIVRTEVRDTGIGIPPDRLDRLFKSFSQVDSSTTRKFGGTGLGLAISKRLVELMGGEIGIESQEGKGTTFWFTLKLGALDDDRSMFSCCPADAMRATRVFAVESDPTRRKILFEHLSGCSLGASQVVVMDDALGELRRVAGSGKPFEIAFIPYKVAGSAELCGAIAADAALRNMKLIAVVESDETADEATIKAAGFFSLVRRPLMQSRLIDAIASAVVRRPDKAESSAPGAEAPPNALKGLHLLVAEDNEMNQFVTQEILRRFGCTCQIVGDGAAAVKAVETGRYDAVLMDCQMPGMDGLEAARNIREMEAAVPSSARLPIIALTAEAIAGDREKCLVAGMDSYVTKPIDTKTLFAAIAALVPVKAAGQPVEASGAGVFSIPESDGAAPIDVRALMARCLSDAEFACRTLKKFQERAIGDVERLRQSAAGNDAPAINRVAHNLKAVAAHVGAETLKKIALNIEQLGAARDLGLIELQLAKLEAEARRCAEFIPHAVRRLTESGQPDQPTKAAR